MKKLIGLAVLVIILVGGYFYTNQDSTVEPVEGESNIKELQTVLGEKDFLNLGTHFENNVGRILDSSGGSESFSKEEAIKYVKSIALSNSYSFSESDSNQALIENYLDAYWRQFIGGEEGCQNPVIARGSEIFAGKQYRVAALCRNGSGKIYQIIETSTGLAEQGI